VIVNNSINSHKTKNDLSPQIIKHIKDHEIWRRWKSGSLLWTGTKMWRSLF